MMIRSRLVSFFTLSVVSSIVFAIACGSGGGGGGGGGGGHTIHFDNGTHQAVDAGEDNPADLATASKDMGGNIKDSSTSTNKPDLVEPTTTGSGCLTLAHCLFACTDAACLDACPTDTGASSASQSLFQTAFNCGANYCVDAGACAANTSGGLSDGNGTGSCDACLFDALAKLVPEACSSSSSPDCNPASCKSSVTACISDG